MRVVHGQMWNEKDLGEPFEFYPPERADPGEPDIILDGAVKPPTNLRVFVNAVNYWCALLAKIRVAVPGATGQDTAEHSPPVIQPRREGGT